MGWFEIGHRERYVKCRRQVYAKEMCMEERDHDVGGGVGGAAKAVCVKRAGYIEEDLKLDVWQ